MVMFMNAPQSHLAPLWQLVHGEERVELPALPELLDVLWEIDIYPDLEMVQNEGPRVFESRDAASEELRIRLYVPSDAEHEQKLRAALDELLIETPSGLQVKGAPTQRQGLVSWSPQHLRGE